MLYEARQNQEAGMLEVIKSSIRLCADTAMLIGQTKFEILSFRRAKMMSELILNLVVLQPRGPPKITIIYQSKSKIYLKLIKWILQFQISHLLLAVPYQLRLINLHKIKSSLLFCTGARGHPEQSQWYQPNNQNYNYNGY